MRAILGVSQHASAIETFEALLQLQFPDLEIHPTHVIEHVGSTFGKYLLTATESDFYAQYMQTEQVKARALLSSFENLIRERGIPCHSHVREGQVTHELMQQVREVDGDLICVSLRAKESLGQFFFGPVGRKLIFQCPSSFFVHKPLPAAQTIRRAVFATDHSPFAQQALDRLIRLQPKGLEHIAVLTAYPQNLTSALAPFVSQLGVDVSRWVDEKLQEENMRVVKRLESAGFHAVAEVSGEPVHDAIETCLKQQRAGLVILGAQGHGMMEGLGLGSVAAYQILHTDHPVLVVRP